MRISINANTLFISLLSHAVAFLRVGMGNRKGRIN
jgi:hypothetical protein